MMAVEADRNTISGGFCGLGAYLPRINVQIVAIFGGCLPPQAALRRVDAATLFDASAAISLRPSVCMLRPSIARDTEETSGKRPGWKAAVPYFNPHCRLLDVGVVYYEGRSL